MKTSIRTLSAATLALTIAASGAATAEMSFTAYAEPTNPFASSVPAWAEAIKERTNGEVAFDLFLGGSLLSGRDGLGGIGSGIAQAGQHAATYTPSENPLWAALADISFKAPDPLVMSFAATEYALFDPEGKGEWLKNNVISLAGLSTAAYVLLCKPENIKTLEDLKGKRIRTAGGPWARFVNSIGAVDVNVSSPEIYTGLERGVIDCTASDSSHIIVGSSIGDVVESVLLIEMGPYFPGSAIMFNVDTWNSLSDENKKIVLEETAKDNVKRTVDGYIALANQGLDAARKKGIGIYEPDAALTAAYEEFLGTLDGDIVAAGEKLGVTNIEQEIGDFTALIEKWEGLLADVDRTDIAALTDLINREIYDRVDVATLTQP